MVPTHVASVNMDSKQYTSPMGWMCTCRFDKKLQTMLFGSLSDPAMAAAAKHLQDLIPKADKGKYLPVVILSGGSGEKEKKAAQTWAKKNGLNKILVGVSVNDDARRTYKLTDQCTILVVDDIHKVRQKFVGFNKQNQEKLDKALGV